MILKIIVLVLIFFSHNLYSCELEKIHTINSAKKCFLQRNKNLSLLKNHRLEERAFLLKGLNKADVITIRNYISGESKKMNNILWKKRIENFPRMEKKVERLNIALEKIHSEAILLHRGLNIPQQYIQDYQINHTVTWKGFTSTSLNYNLFFVTNIRFFIIARSAKKIWPLSPMPEEWEYLIPANTSFKVLDVKKVYYKKKGLVHEVLLKEL